MRNLSEIAQTFRRAAIAGFLALIVFWNLGEVILPTWAIEPLVVWLVPPPGHSSYDYNLNYSIRSYARRLIVSYLRFQTIKRLTQITIDEDHNDPDELRRMVRVLTVIRGKLLSQEEIYHPPSNVPSIFSGVGWCDQLNNTAAQAATYLTGKSDVIALIDREGRSPHSIARTWSPTRDEWIYFDVWPSQVIIFTDGGRSKEGRAIIRILYPESGTELATGAVRERMVNLYAETLPKSRVSGTFRSNFIYQVGSSFSHRWPAQAYSPASEFRRLMTAIHIVLFARGITKSPGIPALDADEIDLVKRAEWRNFLRIRLEDLWAQSRQRDSTANSMQRRPIADNSSDPGQTHRYRLPPNTR